MKIKVIKHDEPKIVTHMGPSPIDPYYIKYAYCFFDDPEVKIENSFVNGNSDYYDFLKFLTFFGFNAESVSYLEEENINFRVDLCFRPNEINLEINDEFINSYYDLYQNLIKQYSRKYIMYRMINNNQANIQNQNWTFTKI